MVRSCAVRALAARAAGGSLAILGALACAVGAQGESDNFGFNPSPPTDSSSDDASSSEGSEDDSLPKEDEGPEPGDSSDSGAMMTTAVADTGDETTGGPLDGGSTSDDGGTVMMCQNETTCPTAMVIGGVSGDEASPQLQAMGDEPVWLTFEVAENNDSIGGETLSFTATLVSPPGLDFDLYAYRGASGGSTGCGGAMQSSSNIGTNEVVSMTWGEGAFGNNADDDAWIAVEIRAKNGMCQAGAQWTLTVQGDT
jgi:hypothetical protein